MSLLHALRVVQHEVLNNRHADLLQALRREYLLARLAARDVELVLRPVHLELGPHDVQLQILKRPRRVQQVAQVVPELDGHHRGQRVAFVVDANLGLGQGGVRLRDRLVGDRGAGRDDVHGACAGPGWPGGRAPRHGGGLVPRVCAGTVVPRWCSREVASRGPETRDGSGGPRSQHHRARRSHHGLSLSLALLLSLPC